MPRADDSEDPRAGAPPQAAETRGGESGRVRRTLAALSGATLVQRLAQFVAVVLVAQALGVSGFGEFAFGVQVGNLIALLSDSGIRVLAAREAAACPEEAGSWIRASIRTRFVLACTLYGLWAVAAVLLAPPELAFLLVVSATALPAVADMKGLADATGRTSTEAAIECVASVTWAASVALLVAFGEPTLVLLAGALLASRLVYAACAAVWLRPPQSGSRRVRARDLLRVGGPLSLAQVTDGLVLSSDVILLRAMGGPAAAGLFSAAQKITAAAEVPSHLLGRLFQPHLHHAAARGDAAATLERTVRATAYVTLPVAFGGWIVAEPLLVRVFGDPAYAQGGWTLRWLLVVTVLMGVGARYSNMLFARREHRAYLAPIVTGTVVNLALTLLLIPVLGSTGTALATAAALLLVALGSFLLLRARFAFDAAGPFARPLVVAVAVGAAAWAVPPEWGVLAALAAGAVVFAALVFAFEVRGRWSQLGEGLQRGSGFAPGGPSGPAHEDRAE